MDKETMTGYILQADELKADMDRFITESRDKKTEYKYKLKLILSAYIKSREHERVLIEGLMQEIIDLQNELKDKQNE